MVNYAGSKCSKKCDITITELWITGGTVNESRVLNTSYPFLSSPQNLIAQSQSGTGKTAAFVLAMLSHVDPENRWPQVWNASEAVNVMHGYNSTVLVLMLLWLSVSSVCVCPPHTSSPYRRARSSNRWANFTLKSNWCMPSEGTNVSAFILGVKVFCTIL